MNPVNSSGVHSETKKEKDKGPPSTLPPPESAPRWAVAVTSPSGKMQYKFLVH